jgi:hypothetical protein
MEHKGIPYQVVQTASPTGFRWTVEFNSNRTRIGTPAPRENAIFQAVCVIDKAIRPRIEKSNLRPHPLRIARLNSGPELVNNLEALAANYNATADEIDGKALGEDPEDE